VHSLRLQLVLSLTLMTLAGCGNTSGLPEGETGTVSGTLTIDGKPAPAGYNVVMLHSESGLAASGATDASGAFSLQTRGNQSVLAGEYNVGVTPPAGKELTPEEEEAVNMGKMEPPTNNENLVPAKYMDPNSSGEVYIVKAGENTYSLDIKSE